MVETYYTVRYKGLVLYICVLKTLPFLLPLYLDSVKATGVTKHARRAKVSLLHLVYFE